MILGWMALCVSTALLGGCVIGAPGGSPAMVQERQFKDGLDVTPPTPPTKLQLAQYKRVFPNGSIFRARSIPAFMLRSTDLSNDTYIEVYNNQGKFIGYLRDFRGPVCANDNCAYTPVHLLLIYKPSYEFVTLIPLKPLQQKGNPPLSEQEVKTYIESLQSSPSGLSRPQTSKRPIEAEGTLNPPETPVDSQSQLDLLGLRLVQLSRDTQQILRGAPIAWDQQRLSQILENVNLDNHSRAKSIARILPRIESSDIAHQAYRILTHSYLNALQADGIEADLELERRLLNPHSQKLALIVGVIHGCYLFASEGIRAPFVKTCIAQVENELPSNILVGERALLRGTFLFNQGMIAKAVSPLELAAQDISIRREPILHLRLTSALTKLSRNRQACAHAQELYYQHPLLEGAKELLRSCKNQNQEKLINELQQKKRTSLLSTVRSSNKIVPTLQLENENSQKVKVELNKANKISVVFFFEKNSLRGYKEIAKLNAFAQMYRSDKALKDAVQIIGIQMANKRKIKDSREFINEYNTNFPILIDPNRASNFASFTRTFSVPSGMPTIAVTNAQGHVRFLLPQSDYNDTALELMWIVQELVISDEKN